MFVIRSQGVPWGMKLRDGSMHDAKSVIVPSVLFGFRRDVSSNTVTIQWTESWHKDECKVRQQQAQAKRPTKTESRERILQTNAVLSLSSPIAWDDVSTAVVLTEETEDEEERIKLTKR